MNLVGNQIYRIIILVMITSFIPVSLISKTAECAMADSQMVLPNGNKVPAREIDTEKVRRTLENKIVAERLRAYGLSKEEVIAKMDKMSDGQIYQLASLSDRLPAGGVSDFYFATTTIVLVAIIVGLIIAVIVLA
jgi:uncharacterized protein DUF6627